MPVPVSRRQILTGARALMVAIVVLPLAVPARALAPAPDLNSPMGSWSGNWDEDNTANTGTATLVIKSLKLVSKQFPNGPSFANGSFSVGGKSSKNYKFFSQWVPSLRSVNVSSKPGTRKPVLTTTMTLTLSQDGNTLSGSWGRNLVPGGGMQTQGHVSLTRQ